MYARIVIGNVRMVKWRGIIRCHIQKVEQLNIQTYKCSAAHATEAKGTGIRNHNFSEDSHWCGEGGEMEVKGEHENDR